VEGEALTFATMKAERSTVLFAGKIERPRKTGRGPGRPTREEIARRNQELLDRALDLFLEHGFEATTIDAISGAIGMSRRTIYARYGDKTTLFKAALQGAIDEWIVPIETLRAAECDDLERTLLHIARLWAARIRTSSGTRLLRIANIEMFKRPEIAAYLWEGTAQQALGFLEDLFRRRLRPGGAGPGEVSDAAMAFLILLVEGSVQLAAWRNLSDEEFDRQIAYRTRLFLHGAARAGVAGG
jgi:AcrR family transcriptional regulator